MMILDNLALFLRIVEKGGLAPAGRELGLSPASVSEGLVALEKYYGATLLHRTTRAIIRCRSWVGSTINIVGLSLRSKKTEWEEILRLLPSGWHDGKQLALSKEG
jgi:hypothetical protein